MDRLAREHSSASAASIVARASFLTNDLKGSKTLSSFQIAREYLPLVAGFFSTMIAQYLLDAHIKLATARATHKTPKVRPVKLCLLRHFMMNWESGFSLIRQIRMIDVKSFFYN